MVPHETLARVVGMPQMHVRVKIMVSHDALHLKGLYTFGREQYYKLLQACCTLWCMPWGPILFAALREAILPPLLFIQLNTLHICTLPQTSCQLVCRPLIMLPGAGLSSPPPPLSLKRCTCAGEPVSFRSRAGQCPSCPGQ